ncbi:MAG TPA: hypothetical protein VHY59_06845 [Chthoniobacterales bacterium]|nr:hypothetical protein [Chthoniobacterales bacterium]
MEGENAMPSGGFLDEQSREFHYRLGSAITEWAHIEAELFEICASVLNAAKHHVAIVYYRTPTLDARLKLTDELVGTLFPERKPGAHPTRAEKEWKSITKKMGDELPTRNQLAHSPASPMVDTTDGNPFKITDIWFASNMSRTEKLRGRKIPQDLKVEDIKSHIGRVGTIQMDLRSFRSAMLPALLKGQP